ncbi:hypothetical protein MEA186_23121 [Mesorhizobium amorphae CCNWGS0123]|uniref:Uncharacterized protein n=1 Tax=Mesorhizobium amorphae CCNWGS0123 TaxID=1082933 RepID=G6YF77_9HYPH|nr:hypothetical protein MEA186_23121 [Mesorhizobium amorphae CCNWGS0123]
MMDNNSRIEFTEFIVESFETELADLPRRMLVSKSAR